MVLAGEQAIYSRGSSWDVEAFSTYTICGSSLGVGGVFNMRNRFRNPFNGYR